MRISAVAIAPFLSLALSALAQHGFFGIENDVVKTIADWIKSQLTAPAWGRIC